MTTSKMLHNANKVAYIVQQYPDKKLGEIIALLAMPAIEINTAIWYATELGFITEPDKETGMIMLGTPPETWNFGPVVEELIDMLEYSFEQLYKKETDLEENYLGNWTLGYSGHDVLVAMKRLLEDHVIWEYELTDPKDLKSTYTFYTSYDSREQMWGNKQFDEKPTGAETPDTGDENTTNIPPEAPSEE